jgi:NADH-quinone oxidoreductase subunit J
MTFQSIIFYIFASILTLSGLRVITARNPVHAALFLVLAFFTAAGLWLLIYAEFLAITLVLVYVGAVMVLFLFVVMMLDINFDKLREGFWKYLPVAATVAVAMVAEMALLLTSKSFGLAGKGFAAPTAASNTKALGMELYTKYLLPFELASVILLVAIVAAIALTLRERKEAKSQVVGDQVRVKAADRLKIVKMEATKEVASPVPAAITAATATAVPTAVPAPAPAPVEAKPK